MDYQRVRDQQQKTYWNLRHMMHVCCWCLPKCVSMSLNCIFADCVPQKSWYRATLLLLQAIGQLAYQKVFAAILDGVCGMQCALLGLLPPSLLPGRAWGEPLLPLLAQQLPPWKKSYVLLRCVLHRARAYLRALEPDWLLFFCLVFCKCFGPVVCCGCCECNWLAHDGGKKG